MVIDTELPTTEDDEQTSLTQMLGLARELLFVVIGALIVCSLLRFFVGQMFVIPSASMENTLLIGDKVVAEKITDVQRGDVVVFADPGIWLRGQQSQVRGPVGKAFEFVGVLPNTSTGHIIKRVVGMPGDKVICCDAQGRITVNGQPLDETSYLYRDASGKQVAPSLVTFEVVVPKDRLFVLGDHRDESADSRCHLSDVVAGGAKGDTAFVPIKLVVGPTVAVVAPFNRAERLHRPATFANVPAATGTAPDQAVIKPAGITC
jgi:signal peptidase I